MLLKPVPKNIKLDAYKGGLDDDPMWFFFRHQDGITQPSLSEHIYMPSGENNTKYYYRKNGDNLEPLGKFTRLDMPVNQARSSGYKGYLEYTITFDRSQSISNDADNELYYTDEPPAAGSVPLTINDIKGGKNTKKYRKNTKKYRKNTKKYRKTINKKRRLK